MTATPDDDTPGVDIVVPCLNEEGTIGQLLRRIADQTYPREKMTVYVVDGRSQDATRAVVGEIRDALAGRPRVVVVDNPDRAIPQALNRGIAAGTAPIVLRVDAHSLPARDYVARCVNALCQGRGENVGGVLDVRPSRPGPVAAAIASAAVAAFGAGGAAYRTGQSEAGATDTVPFGAYRRDTLERLNGYDATLSSNEDYDLNVRLRAGGGTVWLDPAIRCTYFSRGTYRALARQYGRYGYWKRHMLARDPGSVRLRQLAAPALVGSMLALLCATPFSRRARTGLGALTLTYAGAAALAARRAVASAPAPTRTPHVMGAFAVMHGAWGGGFLAASARLAARRVRRRG